MKTTTSSPQLLLLLSISIGAALACDNCQKKPGHADVPYAPPVDVPYAPPTPAPCSSEFYHAKGKCGLAQHSYLRCQKGYACSQAGYCGNTPDYFLNPICPMETRPDSHPIVHRPAANDDVDDAYDDVQAYKPECAKSAACKPAVVPMPYYESPATTTPYYEPVTAAPAYPQPSTTSYYEAPTAAPSYTKPVTTPYYEAPTAAPSYTKPVTTPYYEAPTAAPSYTKPPYYEAPTAAPSYTKPVTTTYYEAPTAAPSYTKPVTTTSYELPARTTAQSSYEAPTRPRYQAKPRPPAPVYELPKNDARYPPPPPQPYVDPYKPANAYDGAYKPMKAYDNNSAYQPVVADEAYRPAKPYEEVPYGGGAPKAERRRYEKPVAGNYVAQPYVNQKKRSY